MSLPPAVQYVTEAQRRLIRWTEHEALVGSVKFGTSKQREERVRSPGRGRKSGWRLAIDLRSPAPYTGPRPSTYGRQSFHFAMTFVTKTGGGRACVTNGVGGQAGNAASGYEIYINADAIERDLSEHETYLEIEKSSDGGLDRASRAEHIHSNIGQNLLERKAFWDAAWAAERTLGTNTLILDFRVGNRADWQGLAGEKATPASVAKAIHDGLTSATQRVPKSVGRLRMVQQFDLFAEGDLAWARALRDRFGSMADQPMIRYAKPRGGAVQIRVEAELPDEFDLADRACVTEEFGKVLDACGLRYTIVVHVPDATNDRRNFHIHAIAYPGSCQQAEDGKWVFGKAATGCVKRRPGELAVALGEPASTVAALGYRKRSGLDAKALRRRFSEIVNDRLVSRGSDRRYDPRTYAEMGVAKTPEHHLGPGGARLAMAGVPVLADQKNAAASWAWQKELLVQNDARRRRDADLLLTRFDERSRDVLSEERVQIGVRISEYRALAVSVNDGLAAVATIDIDRAIAESAAQRLLLHSDRVLDAIQSGQASTADIRDEPHVRCRRLVAERHLAEIEDAVSPWQDDIEQYRAQLLRDEQRLVEIRLDIEALLIREERKNEKRRDEQAAVAWRMSTILDTERYPERLSPHKHFAALIEHVTAMDRDRSFGLLPVYLVLAKDGGAPAFIGFGSRDLEVLNDRRFKGRMEIWRTFAKHQADGVDRLSAYVETHGSVGLLAGREVPKAIATLFRKLEHHPLFVEQADLAAARHAVRKAAELRVAEIDLSLPVIKTGGAMMHSFSHSALFPDEVLDNDRTASHAASGSTPVSMPVPSAPSDTTIEQRRERGARPDTSVEKATPTDAYGMPHLSPRPSATSQSLPAPGKVAGEGATSPVPAGTRQKAETRANARTDLPVSGPVSRPDAPPVDVNIATSLKEIPQVNKPAPIPRPASPIENGSLAQPVFEPPPTGVSRSASTKLSNVAVARAAASMHVKNRSVTIKADRQTTSRTSDNLAINDCSFFEDKTSGQKNIFETKKPIVDHREIIVSMPTSGSTNSTDRADRARPDRARVVPAAIPARMLRQKGDSASLPPPQDDSRRRDLLEDVVKEAIAQIGVREPVLAKRRTMIATLEKVEREINTGQLWLRATKDGIEASWLGDVPDDSLHFLKTADDDFVTAIAFVFEGIRRPAGSWMTVIVNDGDVMSGLLPRGKGRD
jgi:hypothetical protein